MQPDEPASPSAGTVWIKTALSGGASLNALTKNALTVALTGCKQYVSGAWVRREAYLYSGSAWVQFATEQLILFAAGGGDTAKWTTAYQAGGYTVTPGTVADDGLTVTAPYDPICVLGTVDKIDVTNLATVNAEATYTPGGGGTIKMTLPTDKSAINAEPNVRNLTSAQGTATVSIDVSALTGEYYVAFMGAGSSAAGWGASAKITKVWCE